MFFLNFLFPKTCLSCGRWGRYICDQCRNKFVPIQKDACVHCDKISRYGLIHDRCQRMNGIDGYIGLWYLTPPLQQVIKKIKYKLVTDAFRALCSCVSEERVKTIQNFAQAYSSCVIQPIPLHPKRYAQRGFNQSDYIALFLHEGTGFPLINNLRRIRNTSQQARSHSRMERYKNMKNAFSLTNKEEIKGKDIILVDDIYTTGNTVKEAAYTCKKAGAARVFVFTFAKG